VALGFIFLMSGCGGGANSVRVSGQLMKDGKPYTANLSGNEPETFAIDFVGTVDGASYVFPATIAPSGAFRVEGAEGRGIPKGEYKIAVCCIPVSLAREAIALGHALQRKERRWPSSSIRTLS